MGECREGTADTHTHTHTKDKRVHTLSVGQCCEGTGDTHTQRGSGAIRVQTAKLSHACAHLYCILWSCSDNIRGLIRMRVCVRVSVCVLQGFGAAFAPYLATVVPLAYESLNQDEGTQ